MLPEDRRVMGIFRKRKVKEKVSILSAPQNDSSSHPFNIVSSYSPLTKVELDLYSSLREALPIIDAAICKINRLLGTFSVDCESKKTKEMVDNFFRNVDVCQGNKGMYNFISCYFDNLLTYGEAVAEIVLTSDGKNIRALYNTDPRDITLIEKDSPLNLVVCSNSKGINQELPYQDLFVTSMLNPESGKSRGVSILKGLPFVSGILLKIFNALGQNWDRVGNVRFAVTYKPDSNSGSSAYTRENAQQIADEWSRVMRNKNSVCDFVSVGDVSIKTIGADNQILDCDVPIRHITEQIVAKLSVPPFLLGLSWSTTERMSSQQADILTSELECYREILNPVIERIARVYLSLNGIDEKVTVKWTHINLQDELELSEARLNKANALKIEKEIERDFGVKESEEGILETV